MKVPSAPYTAPGPERDKMTQIFTIFVGFALSIGEIPQPTRETVITKAVRREKSFFIGDIDTNANFLALFFVLFH
jgi:hypothetical protein